MEVAPGEGNRSEAAAKNKSILVPPMLVHKDTTSAATTTLEKPGTTDAEKLDETNKKEPKLVRRHPSTTSYEELIEQEKWSCYGSTQVDYLLLKNVKTGDETVAAVAPHTMGLSVRSLQMDHDTTTTISSLGSFSVILSKEVEADNDEEDEEQPFESVQPFEAVQASSERAFKFSTKVAEHMMHTLTWLYHNVQDDFPARTIASGKRIVHQIPKTAEQTASTLSMLVRRMAEQWWDGDDDDDNRGRRR